MLYFQYNVHVTLTCFAANHTMQSRPWLGIDHMNKTAKRTRYNYQEKAIKIHNWCRDLINKNKNKKNWVLLDQFHSGLISSFIICTIRTFVFFSLKKGKRTLHLLVLRPDCLCAMFNQPGAVFSRRINASVSSIYVWTTDSRPIIFSFLCQLLLRSTLGNNGQLIHIAPVIRCIHKLLHWILRELPSYHMQYLTEKYSPHFLPLLLPSYNIKKSFCIIVFLLI